MPEIEPWLAMRKVRSLTAILLLQPFKETFEKKRTFWEKKSGGRNGSLGGLSL